VSDFLFLLLRYLLLVAFKADLLLCFLLCFFLCCFLLCYLLFVSFIPDLLLCLLLCHVFLPDRKLAAYIPALGLHNTFVNIDVHALFLLAD
jgi:hypothetical protein